MSHPLPPPDTGRPPGVPRWVKILGLAVLLLLLVVLVAMVLGVGGEHGPGRHG